MKSLKQFLFISLAFFFVISCEKDVMHPVETFNTTNEKLIAQFFDVGFLETNNPNVHSTTGINTRSTDPLITEIMADMQLAEYETAYINELIDHLGFPAWNHAEVLNEDKHKLAVIPFAQVEASSISGVLLATPTDSGFKYRLIDKAGVKSKGSNYTDHEFYVPTLLYLIYMDKVVFNELDCHLASMVTTATTDSEQLGGIQMRDCKNVTVWIEDCFITAITMTSLEDGTTYVDYVEYCRIISYTVQVCESDAQDILGTATPGDDYFVPPPHTDPPVNNDPNGTNPEPNNNILKKLLDLTDEEVDCFNTLAPEVRESLLIDVMSNNIIDPCNPLLSSTDIISDAIKIACRYGEMTEQGVYEAMRPDWIAMDLNLENCQNVSCIFDKLMDFNYPEGTCNSLQWLSNHQYHGFNLEVGEVYNDGDGVFTTSFDENGFLNGTLTVDDKFCGPDADPVVLAETLLHESIHAVLNATAADLINQNPGIDPTWANWVVVLNEQYGGNVHEFMIETLGPIINTLWLLNGQVGDPFDYVGIVLSGIRIGAANDESGNPLNNAIVAWMNMPGNNENNLNQDEWIATWIERYENNVKPNNELNFECD